VPDFKLIKPNQDACFPLKISKFLVHVYTYVSWYKKFLRNPFKTPIENTNILHKCSYLISDVGTKAKVFYTIVSKYFSTPMSVSVKVCATSCYL
jgi:hypothetical protein